MFGAAGSTVKVDSENYDLFNLSDDVLGLCVNSDSDSDHGYVYLRIKSQDRTGALGKNIQLLPDKCQRIVAPIGAVAAAVAPEPLPYDTGGAFQIDYGDSS